MQFRIGGAYYLISKVVDADRGRMEVTMQFKIGDDVIGGGRVPYLIAEIGCNHGGSLDIARRTIEAAAASGADAVKFQCYTPGEMTIDTDKPGFILKDGPWKDRRLFELYNSARTPRDWFPVLFRTARECGITAFSSVFSPDGVAFLESIDCPAYKIASFELTYEDLIEAAAKTGKPVILSTGMGKPGEVLAAINIVVCHQPLVGLLNCTSAYPAPLSQAAIDPNPYGAAYAVCGISDHTLGYEAAIASTAMGGAMIEKHFTLSRDIVTDDSNFSVEPAEFRKMAHAVLSVWDAIHNRARPAEESQRQARRSLYVVKNIKKGDAFSRENVSPVRGGNGLHPEYMKYIVGKNSTTDLAVGDPVNLGHTEW